MNNLDSTEIAQRTEPIQYVWCASSVFNGRVCASPPSGLTENLGILINPDLKLTLSDLGSIRVPNPWRRHELGIYVTSTKEVQRYVVIIHFGSIDRPFYLNTWHFHVVITPRVSMIQIEDRNRIIDLVNWLNCLAHLSRFIVGRILY